MQSIIRNLNEVKSRVFNGIKGMVKLVQDSIHSNLWYCSRMKMNCIILRITITWLLLSCQRMKAQVCIKLTKDGFDQYSGFSV